MPERDATNYDYLRNALPYIFTLLLSCWGGAVHYIQKIRRGGGKFAMRDLSMDLLISSFAGILTHLLCESAHISGAMAAVLIAVSGHMGTRAIASMEAAHSRIFPPQGG